MTRPEEDTTQYPSSEALYFGPVGICLLTNAYRYHSRIALNSQSDRDRLISLSKYQGPYKAPHGCNIETALVDKYANYQYVGVLTEPYLAVGYSPDEYGRNEIEIDLRGQDIGDQDAYDMVSLLRANELGLYEKRGLDYFLTPEGLRVSQLRQTLSPLETRDLIRNAMRQRTHLRVLTEEQGEWNDQEVQQNPVEIIGLSVQEIFSAERTENLGASV